MPQTRYDVDDRDLKQRSEIVSRCLRCTTGICLPGSKRCKLGVDPFVAVAQSEFHKVIDLDSECQHIRFFKSVPGVNYRWVVDKRLVESPEVEIDVQISDADADCSRQLHVSVQPQACGHRACIEAQIPSEAGKPHRLWRVRTCAE